MVTKYTVVQHSGYGYGDKPAFEKGLQATAVDTVAEQRTVKRAGGLLFDTYTDAETYCDREMYPEGVTGLHPQVSGSFGEVTVNELRVYIPAAPVSILGDFPPDTDVFIAHSTEDWMTVKIVGTEDDDGQVPLEVTWTAGLPGYEVGQRITASSDVLAWEALSARTVAAQMRLAADH